MTHPQQTTREVIEQLVDALDHCMGAITERGLNGSPDQAEKWGLQLPLVRAESAITAAHSMLAHPTPSTTGEADEYQYRTKPTWDANAPWSDWTKCNRGSFEDYKRTPVHNDWIYEARALFAATPPQVEPAPSPEVLQALTDPESQPNQFGVVFGMHGPRMFFAIGNRSFDLAYEPDSTEEFEFMKRMLCSAFYTFTPDVKTAPAPSTAGERAQVVEDLLMYAGDNGYSHIDYADTMRHAAALMQSTADHIAQNRKLVAALPVGDLTPDAISELIVEHKLMDQAWPTQKMLTAFALAAARSHPTTEESLVVAGAQPVREPELEHVNCDDCTYHYKLGYPGRHQHFCIRLKIVMHLSTTDA